MQEFYIKKGSVNPVLRMECFMDGRFDYKRSMINEALQSSDATFSMFDCETGLAKILNAKASIVMEKNDGCEERYLLEYKWDKFDTRYEGIFEGVFEINFGPISQSGVDYPIGNLIVPIQEKLLIYIK